VLATVSSLFERLDDADVRYCHWKSNWILSETLAGKTDLDLLVHREDATAYRRILQDLGFRPAVEHGSAPFPSVEHHHALDDASDALVHVHSYYRVISGGSLAKNYHLPLEEMLLHDVGKEGAVIDERFNGGGSAADYIIDVLQRDFDGYFNNVAGDRYPFTSPAAGIWGPKVMIVNEMAGSGGDLMPYMFKRRKIGLLVGKRTWGGLVHTADTPGFVDGGSMIAPRGGFFTRDGKWAVENEGVAPDVDVENWPKDVIAGHDPQLERAVDEAMKLLKQNPPNRLTKEPPSPTWGKRKGGGS